MRGFSTVLAVDPAWRPEDRVRKAGTQLYHGRTVFSPRKEIRAQQFVEDFMSNLDPVLSVMLGTGLAASTGFRVFLPMLIVSVAAIRGLSR